MTQLSQEIIINSLPENMSGRLTSNLSDGPIIGSVEKPFIKTSSNKETDSNKIIDTIPKETSKNTSSDVSIKTLTEDQNPQQTIIPDIKITSGDLSNNSKSNQEALTNKTNNLANVNISTIKNPTSKNSNPIKSQYKVTANNLQNSVQLQDIIGLPPLPSKFLSGKDGSNPGNLEYDLIIDTMPILELTPCVPQEMLGLDMYRLVSAWGSVNGPTGDSVEDAKFAKSDESLKSFSSNMFCHYGVKVPPNQTSLKVCVMNEGSIQESFSNEFGDTIFSEIASGISSSFIRDAAAVLNITDVDTLKSKLGDVSGALAGMMGGTDALAKGQSKIAELQSKIAASAGEKAVGIASQMGNVMLHAALGHGVDFPQVWRSANFSPSYSFTVKLYNPDPGSQEETAKHIYGPLAALMSFVVPRSDNGKFFYAPWYCKFKMKGLIPEYAGYIRNISVSKGGDQNLISYKQIVGEVILKIDLAILYKTMTGGAKFDDVYSPQLLDWLQEYTSTGKSFSNCADNNIPRWYEVESDEYKINNMKNMKNVIDNVVKVNAANVIQGSLVRDPVTTNSGLLNQLTGLTPNTISSISNLINDVTTGILSQGDTLTKLISSTFESDGTAPVVSTNLTTLIPSITGAENKIEIENIANDLITVSNNTLDDGLSIVANLTNGATNLLESGLDGTEAGSILSSLTNTSGDVLNISSSLTILVTRILVVANTQTGTVKTDLISNANLLIDSTTSLKDVVTHVINLSNDLLTKIGLPGDSVIKGAADSSVALLSHPPKYTLDALNDIADIVPTPEEKLNPENPIPTKRIPIFPVANYKSNSNKTTV